MLIKRFNEFILKESNTIIKKGTWIEIKSKKNGLVYLGRVVKNYKINETNSKFLILDSENDFRLIESKEFKVLDAMKKNLEFNIIKNTLPIIS